MKDDRRPWGGVRLGAVGLCLLSLVAIGVSRVEAAGQLVVSIDAAPNLVVDSNVLSPATYAPSLATVAGRFCNYGDAPLTDVIGYIGDFANGTSGIYPERLPGDPSFDAQHPRLTVANGGAGPYSLTHVGGRAGTADAIRWMGDLDVGECKAQFWHFTYPRVSHNGNEPAFGANSDPTDDLWLTFDVWGTSAEGSRSSASHTVTMRSEISASANKIAPNGSYWGTDPVSAVPGNPITTVGINYELGVVNKGFDNDGDGVYDFNAWLQPAGDPAFDPTCLRLIGTDAQLTVSRSGGNPDLTITTKDSLYFTNLPNDNTGVVGVVHYKMAALNGPCGLSLTPYQEAASGADNEKFSGDYGAPIGSITTLPATVALDKTVDLDRASPGTTLSYSLAFSNTGDAAVGTPDVGVPLVITDSIPPGTTYVLGSASYVLDYSPNTGASILYSTDNRNSWTTTEPATASLVTDVSLWLHDPLPDTNSSGSGTFSFQVLIDNPYAGNPVLVNDGELGFGGGAPVATDDAATLIDGTNTIGDYVFDDNGAGGGVALDGLPNGTEPGLANVSVDLYWDKNGDGLLDANDVYVLTTSSDATGAYSLDNLPDGDYIVTVDKKDPDLPLGYSPSSASEQAVTGLGTTQASPVTTIDFGFGPTVAVTKSLPSPNPALEGRAVSYTIDVSNLRPSTRSGCTTEIWTNTVISSSASWTNPGNAAAGVPPDGAYASNDNPPANEKLLLGGFTFVSPPGEIAQVEILTSFYILDDGQYTDQTMEVREGYDGAATGLVKSLDSTVLNNCIGAANVCLDVFDVTTTRAWSKTDFDSVATTGAAAEISWLTGSGGSNKPTLLVDAVGYRITTTATCGTGTDLTTVPLTDTYDADLLTFVSASPPVNSSTTGGSSPYTNTGTLTWDDLGVLLAGETRTVTVNFVAKEPSGNVLVPLDNTATSSGAKVSDGTTANDATDTSNGTLDPTAILSGTVYNDNGAGGGTALNGTQDGAEPGVLDVQVELWLDTDLDGVGDVLQSSVATDAAGFYSFGGLTDNAAGEQYLIVVQSGSIPGTVTQYEDPDGGCPGGAGCDDMTAVTVAAAADVNNLNFGYEVPAAIIGRLWEDSDGDGVLDTGEPGLSSTTVRLYRDGGNGTCESGGGDDVLVSSVTTDAFGVYGFGDLTAPDNYCVLVDPASIPGGFSWTQTGDPDGTVDHQTTAPIAVQPQTIYQPYDFGYRPTGTTSIGDVVYRDWDGDGVQAAGEEGIPNIGLALYTDLNGNGVVDGADSLYATTVTDASGLYTFANLPARDWVVVIDQSTFPLEHTSSGEPDCISAFQDISTSGTPLNLADDGQAAVTLPFAFSFFGVSSTSIVVGNNGGIRFNETAGTVPALNATLPDGASFNAALLPFWDDLDDTAGNVYTHTLGTAPYRVFTIQWDRPHLGGIGLASFQVQLYEGSSRIEFLYSDTDFGDPTLDDGLSATIGLQKDGATALEYSFNVTSVTTGSAICYIPNASGSYDVTDNNPSILIGADNRASIDQRSPVSTRIATLTGVDFGLQPVGSGTIGDFVFLDTNANGLVDPGESGISGVDVRVYEDEAANGVYDAAVDNLVGLVSTDSAGKYLAQLLVGHQYLVDVDENSPQLPKDGFGKPYVLTDPDPHVHFLTTGETYVDADFGFAPGGSLGDSIYADNNGDGTRATAEPGLNGVTVNLYLDANKNGDYTDDGAPVATATTANDAVYGDGYYRFDSLAVAQYIVVVDTATLPANYTLTADPDGTLDSVFAVEVPASRSVLYADFGYQPPGTIGDTVWIDEDGDAVVDVAETPLSGVVLELQDGVCTPGVDCPTATTDINGVYTFTSVGDGTYTLAVVSGLPSNVTPTYDLDGGNDQTVTFTITGGSVQGAGNLDLDFGYDYLPYGEMVIDKDTSTPNVSAGGVASYTIYVQNRGNRTALGTTISDTLPAGFTYQSTTSIALDNAIRTNVVDPAPGTGTPTWGDFDLAPLGSVTITFAVQIAAGTAAATYDNTATSSTSYDLDGDSVPETPLTVDDDGTIAQDADTPFSLDPETDEDVTVAPLPLLNIAKSAVPGAGTAVNPGDSIAYTLQISNVGSAGTTKVNVADGVPSGTTFTPGSTSISRSPSNYTILDNFDNGTGLDQNAGTRNFTSAWTASGVAVVTDGATQVLEIGKADGTTARSADLSPYAAATLDLDYRGVGLDNSEGAIVEVTADGTNWVQVADLRGPGVNSTTYQAIPQFDLAAYRTAAFQIRFNVSAPNGQTEFLYIDNVLLTVTRPTVGGPAHDPPSLVVTTDDIDLLDGETLTVQYSVTVDNPAPAGVASIDNTASTWSEELPTPVSATISHPLNTPYNNTVGDLVWNDDDADTTTNSGSEPSIANVRVELYQCVNGCGDADDVLTKALITDKNGYYLFTAIPNGDYRVTVDANSLPPGYVLTTANLPFDVTLTGASTVLNADFGYDYSPSLLPVTLVAFHAYRSARGLVVEWETATETGNLGFFLYGRKKGQTWQPLTRKPITARGVDSVAPERYRAVVPRVKDVDELAIADVDVLGRSLFHGPFPVLDAKPERKAAAEVTHERIDWKRIRGALNESLRRPASPVPTPPSDGGGVKIDQVGRIDLVLDRTGIYRVSFESLFPGRPDAVDPATLALFDGAVPVPFRTTGRRFGPGEFLEFYGVIHPTLYTDQTVYTLLVGHDVAGVSISTDTQRPVTAGGYDRTGRVVTRYDEDHGYSFASPTGDPWYGQRILAGAGPAEAGVSLDLGRPVRGSNEAHLEVVLWGGSDFPVEPDHHVQVFVNGHLVADELFDGIQARSIRAGLDTALLREGENEVVIRLPHDRGTNFDLVHLESIDLSYDEVLEARNDLIEFASHGRRITVEGFLSEDVDVYGFTESGSVRLIRAAQTIPQTDGRYMLEFPGRDTYERYLAVGASAKLTPGIVFPDVKKAKQLTAFGGPIDLLIISHAAFLDGLDSYVAYRATQGLAVRAVDVQAIYDAYSAGIVDPEALRRYIAAAHTEAGARYVLLVGGDTYDYKDNYGIGSISFVPSIYAPTGDIIRYAPADALYGDVDGDGVPDLAVGRWPVRSSSELQRLITKTMAYEAAPYHRDLLMVSDGVDYFTGTDFSLVSDQLVAGLQSAWNVRQLDIGEEGSAVVNTALIDAINEGLGMTAFVGHSGPTRWSFSNVFTTTDVGRLANSDRPTVAVQWGCWNTYYVEPLYESMSNKLLLAGDQGAAIALGAATLTDVRSDKALGMALAKELSKGAIRIGDALLNAKRDLPEGEVWNDVRWGYTLLGDPTVVVGSP